MPLELDLPAFIRIGTGVLWLGLGLGLTKLRAKSENARWLGIFFIAFAAEVVAINILDKEVPEDRVHRAIGNAATSITNAVAFAALVLLLRSDAREGRSSARRALIVGAGLTFLTTVATVLRAVLAHREDPSFGVVIASVNAAHGVTLNGIVALLGVIGYYFAMRAREGDAQSSGFAWLGAGLCIYPAVYAAGRALDMGSLSSALALNSILFLALTMIVPVVLTILTLSGAPHGRGRSAAFTLLAIALVNITGAALTDRDVGERGIARAIAFAFVAYAFLRLFDGRGTPAAGNRGIVVSGAIAALFVVAQVAQNFLSAQYGLLMGGVVAGALLVAARPIERALEGRHTARAPEPDAAKDDAFRAAVRMALRDRVITREEELHLHRVAQHMGIATGRAHELLIEVEREETARGQTS